MPFMLPTVLKNLFSRPATRLYPLEAREPFPRARGHVVFEEEKCILCGNCARRCPAAAIEVSREKKELVFHPARCIVCEVCAEACNKEAVRVENTWRKPFYVKEAEVYRPRGREEKASAREA